jgi:pyridoxine kinase
MQTSMRPRCLSIQSHTVHGHVGQKAATFPLQLLGCNVDPLNSVQLSNHKGYKNGARGQVLQGAELQDLVAGLEANNLLPLYTHLLTGYIGSASFLHSVLQVAQTLRDISPGLVYFCDPVLGDHGKLYVPAELVDLYKTHVVPIATVLTPNQFECELLTDSTICTVDDAWRACDALHARGVAIVVITSCYFGTDMKLLASKRQPDDAAAAGGEKAASRQRLAPERYAVDIPIIEGRYSGTGDLTAALLLAWSVRLPEDDFIECLSRTCDTVRAVITRTRAGVLEGSNPNCELLLIESAADILHPTKLLSVQRM